MDAAFAGDAFVILSPKFPVFAVFFPVILRNFELETGSNPTASAASACVVQPGHIGDRSYLRHR